MKKTTTKYEVTIVIGHDTQKSFNDYKKDAKRMLAGWGVGGSDGYAKVKSVRATPIAKKKAS